LQDPRRPTPGRPTRASSKITRGLLSQQFQFRQTNIRTAAQDNTAAASGLASPGNFAPPSLALKVHGFQRLQDRNPAASIPEGLLIYRFSHDAFTKQAARPARRG
jgi:hypothetical protein